MFWDYYIFSPVKTQQPPTLLNRRLKFYSFIEHSKIPYSSNHFIAIRNHLILFLAYHALAAKVGCQKISSVNQEENCRSID